LLSGAAVLVLTWQNMYDKMTILDYKEGIAVTGIMRHHILVDCCKMAISARHGIAMPFGDILAA